MTALKHILLITCLIALTSGCTTTNVVRSPDQITLMSKAKAGDTITVYTVSGEKQSIKILEFKEDTIIGRPTNIKYDDIKKVKVTSPDKTKTRLLIILGELILIFITFF